MARVCPCGPVVFVQEASPVHPLVHLVLPSYAQAEYQVDRPIAQRAAHMHAHVQHFGGQNMQGW